MGLLNIFVLDAFFYDVMVGPVLTMGGQNCDPRVPLQRSKLENQEMTFLGSKNAFWGVPRGTI